jgi:hypothetical protein
MATGKDKLWSTHFIKMRNIYINRLIKMSTFENRSITNNSKYIFCVKKLILL